MNVVIRALPDHTWFQSSDSSVHAWGDSCFFRCGVAFPLPATWIPVSLYKAAQDEKLTVCKNCLTLELVRELGK